MNPKGTSLDVQTALFQRTELLSGQFLKLRFPFAFCKSSASISDGTLCFSFDPVNSTLHSHIDLKISFLKS